MCMLCDIHIHYFFHCQPLKTIPEHFDLLTCRLGTVPVRFSCYTCCIPSAIPVWHYIFLYPSHLYCFWMWSTKCCFCKHMLGGTKVKNPDLGQQVPNCNHAAVLNKLMCSFVTGLYFYKLNAVLISKHVYNDVSTCQQQLPTFSY
jgi:hypothetical protein